jgi:hypothetical protein
VKIDEVLINEGIFDKLAAGVAGAKAGVQAGAEQRAGSEEQKKVAAELIRRWNGAIAQDPASNTPENLKQFLFNLTRSSGIEIPNPPAQLNPATTTSFITQVVGKALAAGTIGQSQQAATAATADQSAKPAEKPTLTTGFTMVDDDPVTLKYKNQDFVRNDKGQWAPMLQPNKPITDSSVAKIFDKQEQAIENWKASQSGATPPAATSTPTAPASDTPAAKPASAPAAPETRTQAELRSPKGIKDPSKEVFISGHGIVQKQEDGSWRSLVADAPVDNKDWPALEKMLASASTSSAEPADAEPAAVSEPVGAPVDSTATVGSGGVSVMFKKTDKGWVNSDPTKSDTLHEPGTKQYDALERYWAKLNKKPEPAPTVGSTPAASPAAEPAPAMTESFKRLSKITHGKI